MRRASFALLLVLGGGCRREATPERRFYDLQIQPVFNSFCVGNTSPCHKIDEGTGTALGNLDLTSFEAVNRRPDVLRNYGVYPQPLLLLKSVPEQTVFIAYGGKLHASEIRHAGGKPLSASSDAYHQLKRWLDAGATRDGIAPPARERRGQGGCSPVVLRDDGTPVDRGSALHTAFVADVEPLLQAKCAFSTCHSSPQSDFYLTCGADEAQLDANYRRAVAFVAEPPASVDASELLLRPLDPRAGGLSHTGGIFFPAREDEGWRRLRDWSAAVQASRAPSAAQSPGEAFFAEQVMPVLIRRGCALEGCHSPSGFNDFRLRPGAPGFMARQAIRRNYETALHEFMSLDAIDVRQSRLVKKNLALERGGILHRGGALLEGPGPDSAAPCPTPFVPATASAFCTLAEWHRIERAARADDVSPLALGSTLPLAFVARPPDGDALVEFDTFRGGADLKLADATVGERGRIESAGNVRSALGACAGLAGQPDLDVRGPEWSHDGRRLVFSARLGPASGHDLWVLDPAEGSCRRLTEDNGRMAGPVRVHNFDPVFAPDGSLVFASTRRGTLTLKRLLPNADLFRVGPALDFGRAEPMTWLLNAELSPAFMHNGQLAFTVEKASPDFYQLSGRRINWDLTDYHPLLGQRAQSDDGAGNMLPSIGYEQATEIREALDRNFVLILSDARTRGAGGALAVFNRSIGPFEEGRGDVSFLRAVHLPDGAATGRPGTRGVYRSPYPLPDGEILAAYAAGVSDPTTDLPRYDLVAVDPARGGRRVLLAGGAQSFVEPALGYRRAGRLLFNNVTQLVFGGTREGGDEAVVHFPDLPMLATLLGSNLRRGRNVDAFAGATALKVYEAEPPASAAPPPADLLGTQQVFTRRKPLGSAPLEADGSLIVTLPSRTPLIFELVRSDGTPVFTMQEEHQLGPGEMISPGVPRKLFNAVCGGCHGAVTGQELDIAVSADALTGASVSLSRGQAPKRLE